MIPLLVWLLAWLFAGAPDAFHGAWLTFLVVATLLSLFAWQPINFSVNQVYPQVVDPDKLTPDDGDDA